MRSAKRRRIITPTLRESASRAPLCAFLVVTVCLSSAAGCRPSSADAKPPSPAPVVSTRTPRPIAKPFSTQKPETTKRPQAMPDYASVLAFEARANPFAPAEPGPQDRTTSGANAGPTAVKLTGLMTSVLGAMACVMVTRQRRLLQARARFPLPSGAGELRIVEIRACDIVVEQNGRQWVESLPRP